MNQLLDIIEETGVIPYIAVDNVNSADETGDIFMRDGVPVFALDYSRPDVKNAFKKIKEVEKTLLCGVCNVKNAQEASEAVDVGARFIIPSVFDESIWDECCRRGAIVFPFCENEEQVEKVRSLSLDALSCLFSNQEVIQSCGQDLKVILTGQDDPEKIGVLLKRKESAAVAACLLELRQKDINRFGLLGTMFKIHKFDFGHFGMNCDTPAEASNIIDKLCAAFFLSKGEIATSYFANWKIEVSKWKLPGEKGHIAISTNSVFRAKKFLQTRGIEFLDETMVYDDYGNLKGVFTKSQFGGFAIQICHN
jgi:2-dehydro-3-deoxyphosphogluconate aldolase/(4S)-4-hydroxy-2-oxoglutarate aldolase